MYKLGKTATTFLENYNKYKTRKEAAEALGVSTTRILYLCRKYNITKWDIKDYRTDNLSKLSSYTCENCKKIFMRPSSSGKPNRFCSKKCQGEYIGKKYGFAATPENIRKRS